MNKKKHNLINLSPVEDPRSVSAMLRGKGDGREKFVDADDGDETGRGVMVVRLDWLVHLLMGAVLAVVLVVSGVELPW